MKRVAGLLLATCILPALIYAQAIVYDYSKLYETSAPAVVQVTTQEGSGSGFLVTPSGRSERQSGFFDALKALYPDLREGIAT